MYITNARHFLNDKGAIGPQHGPAKVMAEFHANTIAYATDFEEAGVNAPTCFKCKKGQVEAQIAPDDAIDWSCPRCRHRGESPIGKTHCGISLNRVKATIDAGGFHPWVFLAEGI